jgi:hypothetical protein
MIGVAVHRGDADGVAGTTERTEDTEITAFVVGRGTDGRRVLTAFSEPFAGVCRTPR